MFRALPFHPKFNVSSARRIRIRYSLFIGQRTSRRSVVVREGVSVMLWLRRRAGRCLFILMQTRNSLVQQPRKRHRRSSSPLTDKLSQRRRRDFELDATVGGMGREEEQKKGQTETEFALSITVHGAINFRRRRYCFLCRSIFAICRRRAAPPKPPYTPSSTVV